MNDRVRLTSESRPVQWLTLAGAMALALSPAVLAIWSFPGFVTQDGPAHLYNAQILAESGNPASPYSDYYSVRHQPLPNWAGHILYVGLLSIMPSSAVDRGATTFTLIALSAATAWLKFKVGNGRGVVSTAALAVLVGLNVTWLFGFTGFLLGAALLAVTLGIWWEGRQGLTLVRALTISLFLVIGYFCHPVSLGLTIFGLVILAISTPSTSTRTRLRTFAALLPMIPLGLLYRGLTHSGGPMRPEWGHLTHLFSLSSWISQIGWVEPISLASKIHRPFGLQASSWNVLASPLLWLVAALGAILIVSIPYRERQYRGWGILAGILLLVGLVGPDTLGTSHGHYLPQRIMLLGLITLIPWLRLDRQGWIARFGRAGLIVAFILQSLFIWDYGSQSQRTAGRLMAVKELVGRNQRVATVLLNTQGRFRANQLLHAECFLGVGTGNIIWGDYETSHYYFPVQLRDPDNSPPAAELEAIARLEGEKNAAERVERWVKFLDTYESKIDVVLIWGHEPTIEATTALQFIPTVALADGPVQIWRRKPGLRLDRTGP